MANYKNKKGATGKKYTTYGDRIKVTYTDGSTRVVRPTDASYSATKKAMETDIAGRNPLGIGNKKSKVTAANAIGQGITEGRGLVSSAAVEKRAKQATQTRKNQEALTGSNDSAAKLNKTAKASEQAKIVNEALMNVYRAEAAKAPNVLGYAGKSGLNQFTGGMKSVPYVIAQDLLTTAQGHKASIDNVADPFHGGQSMGQSLRNIAAEQAQKQAALQKQYGYDNFGQIGKTAAEVGSGIVNMAPSLALAPFSAGGSLALMGLSAAGSGANKALNEGANLSDAATYGIMTGAKETGTEMLGGGLPLLPGLLKGGKIVGKLPGLTGATGRVAGNAMDIIMEGGEEALAEYIDPFLQRRTYNPNAKDATTQEIRQAALLGGLTAGVLKGAVGGVNIVRNGIRPEIAPVGVETAPQTKQTAAPNAQETPNQAGIEIIQNAINNTIRGNQSQQTANNEAGNLSGQEQNGNAMRGNEIGPKLQQEATVSDVETVQQPVQQFVDYDISLLSPDARQWLERVGSVSGMNVRVADGLPHNANGMFDGDGNIVLDGNSVTSAESMRKVLGHETYHAMKVADEHKDLQDLAWEWYRMENPNATQQDMLNEKIAQYAESGINLDNDAAWDEIGAEFSERLMVDEKVARRVIAEQPNLAQRIWRKIQQILQRFTGKLSAVEQQQREILQRAEEIYRNGLQSMKYEGVTQDGQQRYMFAGEQSQTADRKALAQAQQMKAAGIDMETIRQETGWFQSAVTGGKWAYEIDDSNAMYRENGDANFRKAHPEYMEYLNLMDKMFQEGLTDSEEIRLQALEDIWGNEPGRLYERLTEGSTQLNDVLEHDALYDAYPQLRNVRVKAEEMNGGLNGSYSSSENLININRNGFMPEKTVLHEAQHAIQDVEGFPKGATPEYWNLMTQSAEDWIDESRLRSRQKKVIDRMNDIDREFGFTEYYDMLLNREEMGEITGDEVELLYQQYTAEKSPEYAALTEELYQDIYPKLKDIGKRKPDENKLYRNTAGEIMARDTAERRKFSAEQRRQRQPQMGNADTVYTEGGESYAIDTANLKAQQLAIIQNSNPMQDDYHTGIREEGDILTFEEAIQEDNFTPDYTEQDAQNALRKGKITIYSSYPISQGVFVTPSKMEAQNYAGGGRVYSKTVSLADVAWIDSLEGQYAKVNTDSGVRYSLNTDRYQENLDQYGAIPPGENPAGNNRDVQVPKQTSDFDRVRGFTNTAMEAEQVQDRTRSGIANDLKSDMQLGRFVYEPTSNRADLATANERIAENGWEETGEQLHKAITSGQRIDSKDIATLERLIQEAQKAGAYDKAVDFVSDLAIIGTESGQNIQALKMLKRLTPEGQLMALKNAQRRINNSLIKNGRSRVPEISNETAQDFLQARGNLRRSEIWDREIARMAKQTEGTWQDKLDAIRYTAMLSNPRTHIRNLISNVAMQAARIPTNAISAALEDTVSLANKKRTGMELEQNHSLVNKTGQKTKELRKYAELAWKTDGKRAMRNVGNRYDDVAGQFNNDRRVFGHSPAGNVLEQVAGNGKFAVGNALDAEDMLFKHATYVNALVDYMKANGITTRDAALNAVKPNGASIGKGMEYAGLQARKATFTEENRMAKAISRLENTNVASKIVVGAVFPFKKTPMNIITRGVEYSPAGLAMTGYKLLDVVRTQQTKKRYNEETGRYEKEKVERESRYTLNDVLESLAANVTGSALLAAGMYLAAQGLLTTTGDDDDSRKARYDSQMGDQNFAVRDPETGATYTIDWLSPSAMPLLTGVEVYNQLFSGKYDETDETVLARAISAAGKIADPVFEMSCMQGVASAVASYSGDAGDIASTLAANVATSYAGQFIPSPIGAVARVIDDTVRSSYASKDSPYTKTGESFLRQQRSKIPVLSQQNEASIDVWGNERKRESAGDEAGDIAMRVIHNFINPGTYSSNKRTALDEELTKLYEQTGESGVLPATAKSSLEYGGKTYSMTPAEYSKFARTKGKSAQKFIMDYMNSSWYQQMSVEERADTIKDMYELANYKAKKEMLDGRGVKYENSTYEKVLQSGTSPGKYYSARKALYNVFDYDTSVEVLNKLKELNMSTTDFAKASIVAYQTKSDVNAKGNSVTKGPGSKKNKFLVKGKEMGLTADQAAYVYEMQSAARMNLNRWANVDL